MTVSTYDQPSYNQDGGTEYPLNIDGAFEVLRQIAQSGAPHATDPNSKKIKVDAIERWDGGTIKSQSEQTSAEFSIPSSDDRIDRVVFDESDLSIEIVQGTEDPSPTAPAIPDGKLPCCQVRLSPSDTAISNDQITDERKAFLFYAVDSSSTTDAQNVTQTYKGNDIDSDGDGTVNNSDQYDGVDPSDGTDGQVYKTDGTNGSFGAPTLENSTGTTEGELNSEEKQQRIDSKSTEIISFTHNYSEAGTSANVGKVGDTNEDDSSRTFEKENVTNNNGDITGIRVKNLENFSVPITATVFGVVA